MSRQVSSSAIRFSRALPLHPAGLDRAIARFNHRCFGIRITAEEVLGNQPRQRSLRDTMDDVQILKTWPITSLARLLRRRLNNKPRKDDARKKDK